MTKGRILLIAGLAIVGLLVLREFGAINLNLYRSNIWAVSRSDAKEKYPFPAEVRKPFSYRLVVKTNEKILSNVTHRHDDAAPIEVEATFQKPVFSGNFLLPFYKRFKMTYQCEIVAGEPSDGQLVDGKISGEVTVVIRGICSGKKAKELAFAEALKPIDIYFQQRLKPHRTPVGSALGHR